ncbi:tetrapyrrole biosynthesis, uroporphyrinogen III synthase [Trichophaea hybrida]|nr:tetrapyrrole biosynthesis, uroporphyrinogen III synthase [Trichophaea hybrida]
MSKPLPIILLKTKSTPIDPYHDHFSTHPFSYPNAVQSTPIFVPILKHQNVNLEYLEELVTRGRNSSSNASEQGKYAGIIITSQRAVEAFGTVLEKLGALEETRAFLADTTVYVVGPATSAAVVALGFKEENVRGKHCGNGAVLAEFILEDYNSTVPEDGRRLPLLFLNNEKRGDIIPNIFNGAPEERRVQLKELVVYETRVVEEFPDEFRKVMEATKGATRWVVAFSPTGADAAWDLLKDGIEAETDDGRTYWASIGPTTERHMVEKIGKRPDVVAAKPSPEGLWKGINEFMKRTVCLPE